ncbi:MAG: chemotaxis protein CheW [Hasllibacter sp.]
MTDGTSPSADAPARPKAPVAGDAIEVLSIRLGEQDYAIPVAQVREIRGWSPATRLPGAPPEMVGVINLRGSVLAVTDLAVALGGPPLTPGPRSVVVVVEAGGKQRGLLIDGVTDIRTLSEDRIQPVPSGRDGAVTALHTDDDGLLRILDAAAIGVATPQDTAEGARRAAG